MGPLLAVVAPSAGIQDRVAARALLVRLFLRFEISSPFCGWRAMQRHADWMDAEPIRLEWASGQAQRAVRFQGAVQALVRRLV